MEHAPIIFHAGHDEVRLASKGKPLLNTQVQNDDKEQLDVSENSGTPKSSILIGFSIINHPF